MDCSSEEQLIRMKLEDIGNIQSLDFDIPNRTLSVYHKEGISEIDDALKSLNLNSSFETTKKVIDIPSSNKKQEKKILWWVLGINAVFFIIEMTAGWLVNSMGLIADSLDMLADASVYGLSLFAVGSTVARKKKVAKISGYLQMGLASLGFLEVLRRFMGVGETPLFQWMIIIASVALVANLVTL
ncbi:MAG TPA: cation transporter [Fodinibius sp.]|nr:cation transporter [Fodinibius sp.]